MRDLVTVRRLVSPAHARDVARIDEDVAQRLIDRDTAEIRSALLSREDHPVFPGAVGGVRPEVVNAPDLLDELAAEPLVRRFAGEDLIGPDAEARQRRGLHGKWLRRPGRLAGDVAGGNRPFL